MLSDYVFNVDILSLLFSQLDYHRFPIRRIPKQWIIIIYARRHEILFYNKRFLLLFVFSLNCNVSFNWGGNARIENELLKYPLHSHRRSLNSSSSRCHYLKATALNFHDINLRQLFRLLTLRWSAFSSSAPSPHTVREWLIKLITVWFLPSGPLSLPPDSFYKTLPKLTGRKKTACRSYVARWRVDTSFERFLKDGSSRD